jgi:hypothetical protein
MRSKGGFCLSMAKLCYSTHHPRHVCVCNIAIAAALSMKDKITTKNTNQITRLVQDLTTLRADPDSLLGCFLELTFSPWCTRHQTVLAAYATPAGLGPLASASSKTARAWGCVAIWWRVSGQYARLCSTSRAAVAVPELGLEAKGTRRSKQRGAEVDLRKASWPSAWEQKPASTWGT